ncbi:hypothetical protein [Alkalibacterium sp.]|nr:MAG: hypothetical protein EA249_09155 [Alkalibacterium sp.]
MDMEIFTQFRLVFGLILAVLLVFTLLSLLPKSQSTSVTFFSVLSISLSHLIIGTALIIVENTFLEDFTLDGDSLTFYMYLGIVGLAVLNPIIYKLRNKRRQRSTYSFR